MSGVITRMTFVTDFLCQRSMSIPSCPNISSSVTRLTYPPRQMEGFVFP